MQDDLGRREFLEGVLGAIALASMSPLDAAAAAADSLPRDLERRLPVWMETARVPGMAVATLRDGRVEGVRALGVRDAESRDPATPETVFEAASLSKVVTAYIALRLVHQGKLALDEPLASWAASPAAADQPAAARITLRHALTHSTGFRNWRFKKDEALTVDFEPGSKFSYSGEGIFWVQRAIEAVTARPFARFAHETLFAPLGMATSSFTWRPEFEARAARGHDGEGRLSESWVMKLARKAEEAGGSLDWTWADAERALVAAGYPPLTTMATPNAAGSLFTTAGEYATFFVRVLEKKARDASSLPDELRAAMRTPQIRAAGVVSWGLGVGLGTSNDPPLVWHWGDSGPAKTFAIGDPATGRGAVVFTNGSRGLGLCQRVVEAVFPGGSAAFLFV